MPGSTDVALAVKTDGFPLRAIPHYGFHGFARFASVLNGHRGCEPGDLKARKDT